MGWNNRKRRRPIGGRKTRVDFRTIIVIIGVAALLGYGTAKFIIYPLFDDSRPHFQISKILAQFLNGKETEGNQNDADTDSQNKNGVVEDQLNVTKQPGITDSSILSGSAVASQPVTTPNTTPAPTTQGGYCIQFGSFSTRVGAENLLKELGNSGITAEIVEKDGTFKVVSQLFEQKEKALESMATIQSQYTDVFVIQR
ncbi:SPOR domain-containing protein [Clostridium aminobutyricum]|uniref:SPOR domain-containing protein n=1 Tax=Clostridium aminobutyricum TaxID=33953 RepID=A0A939D758_CLOAM|nr:SPOR domain-containing protein [Clostridium aminobutyricum]MBN7772669.1 SPOR domain-containing protein [Clostridium aminobutyricum]